MNIEEAIEILKQEPDFSLNYYNRENAIDVLLTAYEKQSKEIEEYKKQLDLDYVDKHFVPVERYNQLEKEIEELKEENKEIREWKFVIDNPIDLKKLSELDLIKIFGKTYISEHKIKAEIEELQEDIKYSANPLSIDNSKFGIKVLQSLLEKE